MTFAEFAAINRARCEADDGFGRHLDTTSMAHWALGICEEAGEVAGVIYAMDHRPQKGKTTQDLADEIADVVSYCDLLAQRIGRSLEDVLRDKWNRVSERIGSPLRIPHELCREHVGGNGFNPCQRRKDHLGGHGRYNIDEVAPTTPVRP